MDKPAMTLRIGLLGGLYIGVPDAGELPLTRKHRLVLAALALAGRPGLSRVATAHLLWGSFAEEQAQASLRQALSALRKTLGPLADVVIADGDTLRLGPARTRIDVEVFSDLLASGRAEDRAEAMTLYRGDLLAGVPMKEDALEEWVLPLRERLRTRAVRTLIDLLAEPGDHDQRARLADQLLMIDPSNEVAHRALMTVYAEQGRTSDVARQFALCRALLRRDLDVAPSAETIRLFDTMRAAPASRSAPVLPPATPPAPAPVSPFWRQKPSVVVLPFEFLSTETDRAFLTRALTSDIMGGLARHRWLSVSAGTAMTEPDTYATIAGGRPTTGAADYVVSGDLRRHGNDLRVTARLLEGPAGALIWSDQYTRTLDDAFAVPEEVAQMIVARLEPRIGARERQLVAWRKPANPGAWDCFHLGIASFYRFQADANTEARALFRACVDLDPSFAEAHAWLAFSTVLSMVYYDEEPDQATLDTALALASRAVELDEMSAFCQFALARTQLARRDYDQAFWAIESALDLNPNMATAYCALGDVFAYQGRLDDAVAQFAKAIHLSPRDPMRWAFSGYCALAHLFRGDFEQAIRWSNDATRFSHCLYWAYAHKAVALGHQGRDTEAAGVVRELLVRWPGFSIAFARRKLFFLERDEQIALYLTGLEKAGVPAG